MNIIAIVNQKGDVAKTISSLNIAVGPEKSSFNRFKSSSKCNNTAWNR